MMFLLLARAFTDASPDTAFPWLNTNATVWGRIHELKRSFFSVLQIIFNLSHAYNCWRHHRGKKITQQLFSMWQSDSVSLKSQGFQKPAGCGNSTAILHIQERHFAGKIGSKKNILGGQGSVNQLPFVEGSVKALVGLYFGSQSVELVFPRMELQPQAQIAGR